MGEIRTSQSLISQCGLERCMVLGNGNGGNSA